MTECVFARHFGHRAEDRLKETRVDRRNQLVGGGSGTGHLESGVLMERGAVKGFESHGMG